MKRRKFLEGSALFTGSILVPRFLKAWEQPGIEKDGQKVLVIIQLSGGNDGLNTVIPVRNDIYYKSRPGIGIKPADALSLNDEASIHSSLPAFRELYNEGSLAILSNVGYPNPDRSHFRSMDIWHSASASNEYLTTGWLGRYLDAMCSGCDHPSQILELDDTLGLALKGKWNKGIALRDPKRLFNTARDRFYEELATTANVPQLESAAAYLYKTMASTVSTAGYIFEQSKLRPSSHTYPQTKLGQSLKHISGLINSDINTKVYYAEIGSFDSHAGQASLQQRLFKDLNDAVAAFTSDLKKQNRFDNVLLFTFSEFGRRVAQNASNGTDHGTANNMFFIGGGLKQKGFINAMPDLQNLQDGDLKYNVDFRDVYAIVLRQWLSADDKGILNRSSNYLRFI
ncbi:DUF1501 domain-containing protein [Pollutibacter soli]|uniref:DUF1501 domain-containing protein n=1 Tax=Pollutibacter soli TaxID=3034157 RepID=UPI0030137FA7